MRIALGQLNVAVGDLAGNVRRITAAIARARAAGCAVVVFPELAIPGYPPEDLLFKPSFIQANLRGLHDVVAAARGIAVIVGYVERGQDRRLYNAAAVAAGGRVTARYYKQALPNYGVFDERRYFTPGTRPCVTTVAGTRVGLSICEDLWSDDGPVVAEARAGAQVLINLSASPYHAGKLKVRERLLARRARQARRPFLYVNLVGGQDELVFDGGSLAVDAAGRVRARAAQFREDLLIVELPRGSYPFGLHPKGSDPDVRPALPLFDEVYEALVLGTRDYVRKNGFADVVVGMSGGIDSALTAAIAVEALGPSRVTAVSMPSPYSSRGTQQDAQLVAQRLGIRFLELPITPVLTSYVAALRPVLRASGATEENLQARIRGTLLMALSNQFGWLVLSTGNKSELSTGYCTLYGDMVGGFAVLKDVPKTWVYQVARVANRRLKDAIPERVFRRPPTAELRPRQRDQDTLPPYPVLDRLVTAYVEQDRPAAALRRLAPASVVAKVVRMVDAAEYKRRQAPPGIKITPRAFGRDRRMPITNRFREE
ncbi:MAG: NAD+ synthase [Candidatus Omnitrophica bacterium]|nr:NAD+ synthase [Candidatus Omnitrophota bacterium]